MNLVSGVIIIMTIHCELIYNIGHFIKKKEMKDIHKGIFNLIRHWQCHG